MSITTQTINRITRVTSLIEANSAGTSPGPWYMSHGHVISPGKKLLPPPGDRFPKQADFDVCATPSGKDHTVYRTNPGGYGSGRGDMRYIATVEPVAMRRLVEDVRALLNERDDVTELAVRLDDLINNTMGGHDDERAKRLGEAVEAYLSSAP